MDKEIRNYVVEKTNELINANTCSNEAKEAAQTWMNALGSEKEAEETKKYINELKEDIMPIDNLINFAESEQGTKYFGSETASNIAAHANEIKSAGKKYCDCPACAAAEAILEKKDLIV